VKVIVAGSRHIDDYSKVEKAIKDSGFDVTEVVSGCAYGVDTLGERWAEEHKVPVKHFVAYWRDYGNAAGPMRNAAMANYADALVLVWDGMSRGSKNMLARAREKKLPVYQYVVNME
jgi:hypothetical protein